MTTDRRPIEPHGGLDLIDRAVSLLRHAGSGALVFWALGTVPFLLALLYFFFDVRRNPLAEPRLPLLAAVVTLLYVWMKTWQTVFGLRLRAFAARRPAQPVTLRDWLRLAAGQARLQPTSFVLLPAAALIALPFGWVYAYYQSLSVTGDPAEARAHAALWPRQNHVALFVLSLFNSFVFLNVVFAMVLLPGLLQSLLGIETAAGRAGAAFYNSTTFVVALACTYFLSGPLIRAVYVLRGLDGDAQATGEDLLTELAALDHEAAP